MLIPSLVPRLLADCAREEKREPGLHCMCIHVMQLLDGYTVHNRIPTLTSGYICSPPYHSNLCMGVWDETRFVYQTWAHLRLVKQSHMHSATYTLQYKAQGAAACYNRACENGDDMFAWLPTGFGSSITFYHGVLPFFLDHKLGKCIR